jgi:hypothetical protein
MAKREHRLLHAVELPHEALNFTIHPNSVGRGAAGNQYCVKIFGGAIGDQLFGAEALSIIEASLSPNPLPRALVDADDRDHRTRFFERPAWFRQFDLLKPVANQSGDALPFYSLPIGRVIRAGL